MNPFTETLEALRKGRKAGRKPIPLGSTVKHLSERDLREVVFQLLAEIRRSMKSGGKLNFDEIYDALYKGRHLKFVKPALIGKLKIPKLKHKMGAPDADTDEALAKFYKKLKDKDLQPGEAISIDDPKATIWRSGEGVFHEVDITPSIGKKRKQTRGEDAYLDSAKTDANPAHAKKERCHSIGPGFGFDSPYGLYFCDRETNQNLQNKGIEEYIRRVSAALPEGEKLRVVTRTVPRVGGTSLREITYQVMHVDKKTGNASEMFQYAIGMHGTGGKGANSFNGVLLSNKRSGYFQKLNAGLRDATADSSNKYLSDLLSQLSLFE